VGLPESIGQAGTGACPASRERLKSSRLAGH